MPTEAWYLTFPSEANLEVVKYFTANLEVV